MHGAVQQSNRVGVPESTKCSGSCSLNDLGGLARGRASKPGLNGTIALCLICTCSSRSRHSSGVRFNGSLAHSTGSAKLKASSISPVSSSKLAMSKTPRELSPDHQSMQKEASLLRILLMCCSETRFVASDYCAVPGLALTWINLRPRR
jgi:hypothetical protein